MRGEMCSGSIQRVPEYLRDAVDVLEKMRRSKTRPSLSRRARGAPRKRRNPNKLGRYGAEKPSKSSLKITLSLQFYSAP